MRDATKQRMMQAAAKVIQMLRLRSSSLVIYKK